MFRRQLACSFCRRPEREVAKLVAGPRVYICDRCVAIAVELMEGAAPPPARQAHWMRRAWNRLRGLPSARSVGVRLEADATAA